MLKFKSKLKKVNKYLLTKMILPMVYKFYSRKSIDEKKFIFVMLRVVSLEPSFQYMYDYLLKNYQFTIHCHYLQQDVPHDKIHKFIRLFRFMKDAATAKYIVLCDSSIYAGCIPKRRGQKIMNTWHGCGAFKKFGFSCADKIFGGTYKEMLKYPLHPNYDLVTTSSPNVNWAYQEAIHPKNPSCIKALGISRTDVLFDKSFKEQAYQHLYLLFPYAKNKKVILYAPTFRGRVKRAEAPNALEVEFFMKELSHEFVLLIKHHPHVKKRPQLPHNSSTFAMDVTETLSINELLCVSDICISDYSSLIFEYSLFEKPMLFFAFDKADYDDWRGFYYDYSEMTPGPICTTNTDLIDYIKSIDTWFSIDRIRKFKNFFMSSCDGRSTERILNEFLEK